MRWKPLPADLDPAVIRLVVQLRELKDDCGLTMQRLAAKTGYSASSWDRYLSGRALPPRPAVEALAAIVDADLVRISALYDAAADAWRDQQTGASAETDQPDVDNDSDARAEGARSRRILRTLATAAAGAAVGVVVTLLVVEPARGTQTADTSHQVVTVTKRVSYTCVYTLSDGQWFAGNSTTDTDVLTVDMWGPEVAELQCLLKRAGISPGGVDGSFGPLTESAVIKAQKAFQLDVDGQVGPHVWAALRK